MGCCCAVRCILLATCVVQLISTIQRQVLDFLGYMWTPIIANFIQIIITILGIFGAYQYKVKYLSCYTIWTAIWLGWNIFVICIYFEAGILTRDTEVLNMGTGSRSWWLVNGVGCVPIYNSSHDDPFLFPTPTTVEGCVLEYFYIEAVQACIQCILAVIGIVAACSTIYIFTREDDSCSTKQVHTLPYSIEYHNNTSPADLNLNACPQRPMTPRKVKQRSTRSKRGSRRRYYQNPVTKLINASNQNNYNNAAAAAFHSSQQQPNNSNNDFYPAHANQAFSMSEPPSEAGSRPNSTQYLNGRPSPIYMNEIDTVI